MKWLWWKFRGMWCRPFGHVLYWPRLVQRYQGRWVLGAECACGDNRIGPDLMWWSFRYQWRRMRRP